MTVRHNLSFEVPEGTDPMEIISEIAQGDGDESGYVRIGGVDLSWDITRDGDGIELDRRQRLAACLLLMAFDLPQPMTEAARTMMEAARICPGVHTGELGGMGSHQRVPTLQRVRDMVDEMIAETKA